MTQLAGSATGAAAGELAVTQMLSYSTVDVRVGIPDANGSW
jgi:hypothetical protein